MWRREKKSFLKFFILFLSFVLLAFVFRFLVFSLSKTTIIDAELKAQIKSDSGFAPEKRGDISEGDKKEANNSPGLNISHCCLSDFSQIKKDFLLKQADFLEINLAEMKVRLYKEGILIKEVPISLKGDPQGWGGTAAGLYKIESGNRISFSVVAKVYMPYSLHFYGKYYIHGEPYYPDGSKFISEVSGGCIRLSDKDAQSIYEMTEIEMPVLVIDKENDKYQYSTQETTKFPDISAKTYLMADLGSGFVFAEKNADEKLPIASLTKLMTAIVVAENIDLRKSITVKKEMLSGYGSTEGLEAEKEFRVVELLYPLLIESSNDAAEVLSYFLGRQRILGLMEEKAKSVLMQNTQFTDPSGFDPGNVSTAQDLFYLARYIFYNRPPLLAIARGKKVQSFGEVRFDIKKFWNKNVFIDDPTFIGGKTGYTKEAGNTALFIFRLKTKEGQERNIVVVLLGSRDNKTDTQRIYRWLLDNYFDYEEIFIEKSE